MRTLIPVAEPDLGVLERQYAATAVDSTWISSSGEFLNEVERQFYKISGADFFVPTSSGTTALHVILEAMDIGPGDEVIVPSLTYIATANAVTYCGATAVFADVEATTWCIDPQAVADLITARTKAIIAVHLYGHPADMDSLRSLCTDAGIRLIEDAAEAPTATYKGRLVGSLADAAAFSFFGNKILTSGEGGGVATSDSELADRVRLLRGQGMSPTERYFFPVVGYNYRMTNVAAAILLAQMERADEMVVKRRAIFDEYSRLLADSEVVCQRVRPEVTLAPWLFTVLARDHDRRDQLMSELSEKGIESRPIFIPIHSLPPYATHPRGNMDVTEHIGRIGFSLPTSSLMTRATAEHVATTLLRAPR